MKLAAVIGKHDFHRSITVLSVPAGTLAQRDKDWDEWPGVNHGTSRVRIEDAPVWQEVFAQAKEDWVTENPGITPGSMTALFYIVREGTRTSCGCISLDYNRGEFCFSG